MLILYITLSLFKMYRYKKERVDFMKNNAENLKRELEQMICKGMELSSPAVIKKALELESVFLKDDSII